MGSWKADGINGQLSGVLKRHGLKSGAIQRGNERCDTAHIVYSDGHSVGPAIPSSETKTVAK